MLLEVIFPMVVAITTIVIVLIVGIGSFLYKKYVTIPYKNNIIKKYLLEINPNLSYTFEAKSDNFNRFNSTYHLINNASSYKLTDIIVDGDMKSYDLLATHVQSNGKTSTTVTDFKGRFYNITINRKYPCDFILKEERLDRAPKGFSRLDLELTLFNKKFNLYVTNKEEAHHYFTPYVIKRLVELEAEIDDELVFAFINSHIYFGVNDDTNFFEHLKTREDVQKEYLQQIEKVKSFKELLERED